MRCLRFSNVLCCLQHFKKKYWWHSSASVDLRPWSQLNVFRLLSSVPSGWLKSDYHRVISESVNRAIIVSSFELDLGKSIESRQCGKVLAASTEQTGTDRTRMLLVSRTGKHPRTFDDLGKRASVRFTCSRGSNVRGQIWDRSAQPSSWTQT